MKFLNRLVGAITFLIGSDEDITVLSSKYTEEKNKDRALECEHIPPIYKQRPGDLSNVIDEKRTLIGMDLKSIAKNTIPIPKFIYTFTIAGEPKSFYSVSSTCDKILSSKSDNIEYPRIDFDNYRNFDYTDENNNLYTVDHASLDEVLFRPKDGGSDNKKVAIKLFRIKSMDSVKTTYLHYGRYIESISIEMDALPFKHTMNLAKSGVLIKEFMKR